MDLLFKSWIKRWEEIFIFRKQYLICLGIFLSTLTFGEPLKLLISEINFIGNNRTYDHVLRSSLPFKVGDEYTEFTLEEGIQAIKNLEIFHGVSGAIEENNTNIKITFIILEKWTLLPFFEFMQGGNSTKATVGLWDKNFMGKYIEVGTAWIYFRGQNGYLIYVKDPNLTSNLFMGIFHKNSKAQYDVYNPEGKQQGSYTTNINTISSNLGRKTKYGNFSATLLYSRDRFSMDNATEEKRNYNKTFEELPQPGTRLEWGGDYQVGKLNSELFLYDGWISKYSMTVSSPRFGSDYSFVKHELIANYYKIFRSLDNFAANLDLATKNGSDIHYKYTMGGLDALRGFTDGYFRGNAMWRLNLEYRPHLYGQNKLITQGAVFIDSGKIWDHRKSLFYFAENPVLSVGIGSRIIFARLHRTLIRLDVARTVQPISQWSFALGGQQFF